MIDFKNKKILITGATGGIGNSIVKKFVSLNGNVFATGTNIKKLENLKKNYPNIKTKSCDISKHEFLETFIEDVNNELSKIDILINNAGITIDNLSIRMKHDEWQKVIDINLTSTFYLCKYAIKKMLKNKYGKIINITSVVAHTGNLGQSNYAASKAGIVGMSKSLAIEYGKKNIKINCVSPGFIKSDMTDKINEDYIQKLREKISLDKFGIPEDVANAVIFLSSSMSDYITGETIHVNGGMYFS